MSFSTALQDVSQSITPRQLIMLLEAYHVDIEGVRSVMQEKVNNARSAEGRATYKAAQFSVRVILDYAATCVKEAHTGERKSSCKNINTSSTTEALAHLISCEMVPRNLRQAIKDMQGITAREFDQAMAKIMFSRLSSLVHLTPLIQADCALIPCTISIYERHLIIALALSMGASWKYIDEDGKDVSNAIEPGLREKVNNILATRDQALADVKDEKPTDVKDEK
jgi:hypothetical protein